MKTGNLLLVILLSFTITIAFPQEKKIADILANPYDFKMISNGNNKPNFKTSDDSLKDIVVLLHHGYNIYQIRDYFRWSNETLQQKVKILLAADFIKRDENSNLVPNVFITSIAEGEVIRQQFENLAKETADSIQARLPGIIAQTKKVNAFKSFTFPQVSLLVLSDVLLDNWQIKNVEAQFLQAPRTPRHGKNYYAAYQEKVKDSPIEALGVYGNQVDDTLNYILCRYGNNRYTKEAIDKNARVKKELADLNKGGHFNYPLIDSTDNIQLEIMAKQFMPVMINGFNRYKPKFFENYKKSVYAKEVSFEEYFIWSFHSYYTAVTDELIKRKLIALPPGGMAFYAVIK